MDLGRLLHFDHSPDINSPVSQAAIIVLGTISVAVLFVAPVLIGAMIHYLGFNEARAGSVISVELAGMSLATFLAIYLSSRYNWRVILFAALTVMILGNGIAFFQQDFYSLFATRFVIGIANGVAMSTCIAIIGMTANPDRTFGLWVAGQLVFGSLGLYLLPKLIPLWGYNSVYLIVAAVTLIMLFLLRYLPQQGKSTQVPSTGSFGVSTQKKLLGWLGIAAIIVFYIGQYGVWTYLERIGDRNQLSLAEVGEMLAIATVIGIAGALGTASLSNRYGRLLPIGIGLLASVLAMAWLLGPVDAFAFLIAAGVLSFTFNFVLPYLMACVAAVDESGRLIMLSNFASGAGLAGGPALAVALQAESGYSAVLWMGVALSGLSFLLVLRLALVSAVSTQSSISLEGV